jgi:nucleotide-binding universal stress UspA family protein
MAEIPSAAALTMLVESAKNSVAEDRRLAGRYLKRHERAIQGQGIHVSTEVAVGDPARVIRNVARQRKADLII